MRNKLKWLTILVFAVLIGSTTANAAPFTYLPAQASNVNGNTTTFAPGFSAGSWQSPGVGGKSEWYVLASSLFSGPITINDIASISYFTNKSTTAADPDWTFYIYTALQQSGNSGGFYHSRLNSEPYFTNTPSVTSNTWHEWSTNSANPMRFYDQPRSGTFGSYTDPTLADLQAGTITWANNAQNNYGNEVINLFSLQTGSAWANGFTGLVDGLTITLKNGDSAVINFEAVAAPAAEVPEPASLALWGMIGAAGLAGWRKRKLLAKKS